MKERVITAAQAGDTTLRALYESAFPEKERIPWDDLMCLIVTMPLDFTAYYDDELLIGLTIVYPHEPFSWLWYFAVPPTLRGQGRGQRILRAMLDRNRGRTYVLDMESPRQECDNSDQRQRRHNFYLRNGFRDTNVYRAYSGLEFTMMIIGEGEFTIHDWDILVGDLRRHWWPDDHIEEKDL
ncbi:MAG: GNAT family N-acetyltransferase [Muribaculaceae bacterium]|nr:GNAT family N-acetyltransferase [Muribaculaceae bacterium]